MFDAAQWPAALLSPGDSVRFRAEPHGPRPDVTRMHAGAQAVTAARSMSIIDPGMLTTVQDGGRWGHQSTGVPVCGAMDWIAYRTANALVGNQPGAATLEATMAGPKLRFEQRTTFAVAGADLGATLDGVRVPHCAAVSCPAGGVLRFANRVFGARAYLAVDGGIEVPRVLASRSTHVLSRMGGWHGRAFCRRRRMSIALEDASGPDRSSRTWLRARAWSSDRRDRGDPDHLAPETGVVTLGSTFAPLARLGSSPKGSQIFTLRMPAP